MDNHIVTMFSTIRSKNESPLEFSKSVVFTVFLYLIISGIFFNFLPPQQSSTGLLYLSVISLAFLFSIYSNPSRRKKSDSILLYTSACILWLLLGLRDVSGVDDPTYREIFVEVNQMGPINFFKQSFMEPGYIFFNYLIGRFTNNYYIFQGITSYIPLFFIFKGFIKYERYIYIPLAVLLFISTIYFQMLSTSLVRMFIAISLIYCFSLDYLFRKKTLKYIVSIFLIAFFHYSALIMLFFIPVSLYQRWCVEHWKLLLIMIISIMPLIFLYIGHMAEMIGGRYAMYAIAESQEFDIMSLDTLPFLLYALYFRRVIPIYARNLYTICIIILTFSSACAVMSAFVPIGRVVLYMNLSIWFILPMIYKFSRSNWLMTALIVILYSFLYLFKTQFGVDQRAEHLFPYINIFFKV